MTNWSPVRKASSALAGFIVLAIVAAEAGQLPTFRAGVDLVMLNVTVTDGTDRPVGGLDSVDFAILEDGRPQQLSYFARATTGLSVSLLIDSSDSMGGQLPLAQQAALDFVGQLRPGDVAQIVDFDSQVRVLQPFTSDRAALEHAIGRLAVGGTTALYDATYDALRELAALRASAAGEVRREVIVVLSDGEDTSSRAGFDELMDLAARSHSVIYTIRLDAIAASLGPMSVRGKAALRDMAKETGGRLFKVRNASGLSGVYGEIANELTSQYVLGYQSSNAQRDGGWREVKVRVRQRHLTARTRTGYFASALPGVQAAR